ncbi:unnamed protein product [Oppiella nova]|uniref:Amino acid transporter transmembrane domain-containing protein n=1 Tax=Oppiella nova TaxID=334625 RepID=A0A7R9LU93_9ACAR|nr:unnamed protein product [Oppiella nova]CAG2166710.1 unnamed protein product [Oppiella nova]
MKNNRHCKMSGQTTAIQAFMHLLKSYIGSGILAMPKAFSYSGIIIGCIGTPLIGLLCHTCIHMLLQINDHLCQKLDTNPMDFEQLAEKALIEGPKRLRKYSNVSRLIVTVFLFSAQMENMDLQWGGASIQLYLLAILPFLILISFIKNIKHLSIGSMFGNVLQLVSFAIIIYNLVSDVDEKETKLLGNKVPQFFSTTMFTYEGITVTMGLYRSMKNRHNFAKPFGVINTAIVIVMTSYTVVGLLGYLKYGDQVEASITLSLPKEALYISVQLMYSIAITISYPVQLYVAIQLIWPLIDNKLRQFKINSFMIGSSNYMFRTLLVLITYALAALIPKLELILALIGAISCSTVAIMIPPILHTITFYDLTQAWK